MGEGPAGSIAALTLARAGRDVLQLGPGARASLAIGEYVPSSLRPLLAELSLDVLQGHLGSAGRVSIWNGVRTEQSSLLDPFGGGWVLDRARFDTSLRQEGERVGVQSVRRRLRQITRDADGFVLDGQIRARAVIDATGRAAFVARALGAQVDLDAGSFAWCRWQHDTHPDRRVYIVSGSEGWWYTAPLPEQRRAVVWHRSTPERVDAEVFSAGLRLCPVVEARARGDWIEGIQGRRTGGQRTLPAAGRGWCAVGDAALAFDPISGQGVHTAVYTGWMGARAVHAWLSEGSPMHGYQQTLAGLRERYVVGMRGLS